MQSVKYFFKVIVLRGAALIIYQIIVAAYRDILICRIIVAASRDVLVQMKVIVRCCCRCHNIIKCSFYIKTQMDDPNEHT